MAYPGADMGLHGGFRRWTTIVVGWLATAGVALAQDAARPAPFQGWAAVVIAADWKDSTGRPIDAFDNARRDLTNGFLAAGFDRDTLLDRSLRPDAPQPVSVRQALTDVADLTARATRGCLLYVTSHGSPEALVFGDMQLQPVQMAQMIRGWCGNRPTVVVISACYSGIFMEALAAPNRMVMTAARRDRNSFGCGEGETYPWFDGCVIESLPDATDFPGLAVAVRACVSRKEAELGATPPSEPQVRIGAQMQLLLPTLRFRPAS